MTGSVRAAHTALALTNGLLIDGTGAEPIRAASVQVDSEGAITYAGPDSLAPEVASGTTTVNVGGNAILPGFFDCHVHFCLPGGAADIGLTMALPASLKVFQIAERMRTTLEAGVTSARDLMGVDVGFRMAIDAGVIAGPRLVLSVGIVSSTGGHGDMTQLSGINVLPYLQSPGCFPAVADGEDQVRAMTRRILQAGADVVKIAATGGVLTPTDRPDDVGMSVAEIRAVVEEARSRRGGVHVAAHAQGRRGIQNALDGGVDSIEHGYDLTTEQRAQMVDEGTFLVPTLSEVMGSLDPSAGPVALAKKALWQGKARTNFPAAVAAGVKIAAGTDAGAAPEHGHNLRELGLLVDNGLTSMQAIVAATRHSAELCQLDHLVGTLEAGKRADIVVSDGNPLSNIQLLGDPANILLVIKDGVVAKDRAGFLTDRPVSPR
ncbi:MAG: hypothetical protein QG671_2300 [Actinomycetota bacterium]|nr:hypothetical protein [Actinomycetota bacterium]